MELQKFIKQQLGINEVEPEEALKIVSEKMQDMDNALTQLKCLQVELQKEVDKKQRDIDKQYFSNCFIELKRLNLDALQEIGDDYISVGVKLSEKLSIWLERDNTGLYYLLESNDNSEKLTPEAIQIFKNFFCYKNVEEDKKGFQIWVYVENEDNAQIYLKEFCEIMNENATLIQ